MRSASAAHGCRCLIGMVLKWYAQFQNLEQGLINHSQMLWWIQGQVTFSTLVASSSDEDIGGDELSDLSIQFRVQNDSDLGVPLIHVGQDTKLTYVVPTRDVTEQVPRAVPIDEILSFHQLFPVVSDHPLRLKDHQCGTRIMKCRPKVR